MGNNENVEGDESKKQLSHIEYYEKASQRLLKESLSRNSNTDTFDLVPVLIRNRHGLLVGMVWGLLSQVGTGQTTVVIDSEDLETNE